MPKAAQPIKRNSTCEEFRDLKKDATLAVVVALKWWKKKPHPVSTHIRAPEYRHSSLLDPKPHPKAPPLPAFQLPIMVPPLRPVRKSRTPPWCATPPPSEGQDMPSPVAGASTFSDDESDAESFLTFSNEVELPANSTAHTSSAIKRIARYALFKSKAEQHGKKLHREPLLNSRRKRDVNGLNSTTTDTTILVTSKSATKK